MTHSGTPLAATGIAGLDDILRGGLPRRRIYLVQGEPGTGKTTLGLQFLLEGVRLGEPGLYVTLSETEEELRAVAVSHGWDISGIPLHQLASLEDMLEVQAQNTLFHPAEVELHETTSRVLDLVERTKPVRIVFDSLSELRLLAGESLRYRRQILALKQFFGGRSSTVLFLDDGTAERGDLQLHSIAHGVIILERKSPDFGASRRWLEVSKLRGVPFRSGRHDYSIVHGGLQVFPRLVAAEHHEPFERDVLPSGVADLDALLGGGVATGTSTLLLGPAGCGKSSLATQYVKAACERDIRTAVFSFDENVNTVFDRSAGIGIDLREAAESGKVSIRQVDPAEMSPGEFAHAVREAVEGDGAKVIVIDSLNGYLMSMPNEQHLVVQMHELLSYLAQRGVTTILVVAQHGLVGVPLSPVDVTYLADTVVLFRFFEAGGRVRKAISVVKKRIGTHEDSIREFQLGPQGLRVGPPLTEFQGILSGVPSYSGAGERLLSEQG